MKTNDNVYRALNPKMMFERPNGSVSPSAFKDKNGLSVEIGLGRSDLLVVGSMQRYLDGNILKIKVSVCEECNVEIYNDTNSPNKYHRLLLDKNRVNDNKSLTQSQCKHLATASSNELIKINYAHHK